jgi:hypothetical protein
MSSDLLIDQDVVKNSSKLLSVLSKKDNLTLFIFAKRGLKAGTSTVDKMGVSRKIYYTRLKQLMNAGLVEKSEGLYSHTTLGNVIYQNHVVRLAEEMKNTKQMKMIDTLKHTREFSEDEIVGFVSKSMASSSLSNAASTQIDTVWTYESMVSAIVERIEFCKSEILLASRSFNEIIINSILRKANAGVEVKVLSDSSLVKQYFDLEGTKTSLTRSNDKNSSERANVVANPWYPGKVQRKIAKIPFSMIVLDGKEVGIEIVNWNEPQKFYGVVFLREERSSKIMLDFYLKMWENAAATHFVNEQEWEQKQQLQGFVTPVVKERT